MRYCAHLPTSAQVAGSSSLARTGRFTTPKRLLHTHRVCTHASATVIALEVLLAILLRKSIHPHPEHPEHQSLLWQILRVAPIQDPGSATEKQCFSVQSLVALACSFSLLLLLPVLCFV